MAQQKTNIWIDGTQAGGTLKELQKQVSILNREIKDLPRNSEAYRKKVTELKDANSALAQHRASIRGVSDSFKEAQSSVKGMLKQFAPVALGIGAITTAASGLVGAIGGGIRGILEFDTALADLKAVTGATDETMDIFKDKAIEFSARFGESAADIATAFKLAGSARPELLQNADAMAKLTEQAIILSKASGDDVPTSIANLTGTLNAFDAPASRASEVMDILANAAQLGVQEIPYLTEAFGKFGGVANQAGVGIEESAAALEILGKKIKEPSTAGTNMRGILTKLQIAAQENGREFKGLSGELEFYGDKINDVSFLKKTFGEENLLAIQTLINERSELEKLTEQYGETGTAAEQARINSATISEAWNRLVQTFNSQFLGLEDSSSALVDALDWISENFNTIVKVVGNAIKVFAIYKGVMTAMALQQRLFGDETGKVTRSFDQLKKNMDSNAGSAKGLGSALKGIGWTALISLAVEFGKALYDVASGAELARYKVEQFNKAKDLGNKLGSEYVENILKKQRDALKEIEVLEAKKEITAEEAIKRRKKLTAEGEVEIKQQVKKLQLLKNETLQELEVEKVKRDKLKASFKWYNATVDEAAAYTKQEVLVTSLIGKEKALSSAITELRGGMDQLNESQHQNIVQGLQMNQQSKEQKAAGESKKKMYQDQMNLLDELIKKVKEFEDQNSADAKLASFEEGMNKELFILQENIDKKYADEIESARKLMSEKGEIGLKAQEQYNKLLLIQDEDYERQSNEIKQKYAKDARDQEYEAFKENALRSYAQEESYQAALIEIKVARAQAALNAIDVQDKAARAKAEEELRQAIIKQLEWEKQKKLESLADQFDSGEINQEEWNLRKREVERKYLSDVEKMNADSADKISKVNQERFTNALNIVSQAVELVSNQIDFEYKKQLRSFEESQEREKSALEAKYDAGVISKSQYESQVAQLDLEAEERKNQLQAEYARKKKAASKIQAIINGALAITQAFAQLGPIGGAIASALVVASTAQQIAVIDDQPVDQFYEGGYHDVVGKKDGLRYRAKNIGRPKGGMLPNSPSLILASEKGPEYFVPYHLMQNQVVANHVAAIDAIRTNQMFEGGYTMPPGGEQSGQLEEAIRMSTAVNAQLLRQIPRMKAVVDDQNSEKIVQKANDLQRFRG